MRQPKYSRMAVIEEPRENKGEKGKREKGGKIREGVTGEIQENRNEEKERYRKGDLGKGSHF